MREIKFRQWDSIRRVWYTDIGAVGDGMWNGFPYVSWELYPIMQYTGLKDRNGKEIYEGDILSFVPIDHKKFNNPYPPFSVFWNDKECGFCLWSPREDVEVIGNIYENPELLGDL